MNQHRWTYTTLVVLTTVLAPIANVYAQLPAPLVGTAVRSPQPSLPIITPLVVTELETDVAIPTVTKIDLPGRPLGEVPQPIAIQPNSPTGTPIASLNQSAAAPQATKKVQFQLPQQLSSPKLAATTSTFINAALQSKNSVRRQTAVPVFVLDNPSTPIVAKPIAIEPSLPNQPTATKDRAQLFTAEVVSSPLLVVRRNGGLRFPTREITPTTKIINTVTIQAEIARLPQAAPSISQIDELPDNLGFVSGMPTFVFDSDRPQQIIATAIAQVGNTSVAPEPSIAIPVQRPNQSPLPTLPIPAEFDPNPAQQIAQPKIVAVQTGQASWYGREAGPKTANGEKYNPDGLTAAHRTLPFGTKVRVISIKTGKSVTVRINDRGPFHRRRIIDVSAGAAAAIGIKNDGIGDVRMEILANEG